MSEKNKINIDVDLSVSLPLNHTSLNGIIHL